MASLFGKNKLRELAQRISIDDIQDKLEIIRAWQTDYHEGSLKKDKETSREQAYNQDVFIKVLGYKQKPASPFSFEPKATTLKSQLPDAVLSSTDVAAGTANIAAVVELKGASIALDRPQQREGNMSPVQQAFKYKTQYRKCPFVIVSNFYEIRLYHDNQLDFEKWTLDDLINPEDGYLAFKTFYVLLHRDNLTAAKGTSKTEDLLTDVHSEQEKIGKDFYKIYKQARLDLLRDIYRNNKGLRNRFEIAIEKGQKIVDRIVFICFAEDRGLLPDNIIERVVADTDRSSFGGSLWETFQSFFNAIDRGSSKLGIPQGYNGGLFANDPVLNGLEISDAALRSVAYLSKHDFEQDLSVTILGHIFEQSISDLEEIKTKVQTSTALAALEPPVKTVSKRKKEGVFYTPDYIVRYIVDNTLGACLHEHENRLKEELGLKGDILDKTYANRERQVYLAYQTILQNIRVLDPACGSGAFLVYAFDYLMAENKRVDEILGGSLVSSDEYVRDILRNNLFGVDLNEESVEITKLSLWLKTAQPGKKLTTLDGNIKSGNSLIESAAAAGTKAFEWKKEFPAVFKNGGFDVVVGNPPYVNAMDIKKYSPEAEFKFLKENYDTAVGSIDLYIYFFEKGLKLLKDGGKLTYISPNRFLSASYGKTLREWLIENFVISSLVDYSDKNVFEDASTYPVITFINKKKADQPYTLYAGKIDEETKQPVLRPFDSSKLTILNDSILGFLLNDKIDITENVFNKSVSLKRAGSINATSTAKEADEYAPLINDRDGLKIINTGTIDPYVSLWGVKVFTKKGGKFLAPYLTQDANLLSQNRLGLYKSPKIIISKIGLTCEAFYDEKGEYASVDTNCIHTFSEGFSPEYVLSWLNSKLYNYTFECLFDGLRMQGGYLLYSAPNLKNTPIKKIDAADQKPFVEAAKKLMTIRPMFIESDYRFRKLVTVGFGLTSWPNKLNKWWQLEFAEFAKIVGKKKLTLKQHDDLLDLYDKYRSKLATIEAEMVMLTDGIDQGFYKLYGLTAAEIAKVEQTAEAIDEESETVAKG